MTTRAFYLSLALLITGCGTGEHRTVLQNKGSDTLVNIAQAWAEEYRNVNPEDVVVVSGGGSGTGIAALINGTADIANASRAMKPSELAQARAASRAPVQHVVGYDAIAVFLHPANPIRELSIEQLAGIYGEHGGTRTWTDLGVEVPGCKDQTLIVVSRQNNSGTYAYFRKTVLGGSDYRLGTHDLHGSKDVVDLVAKTPCAIGYSGLAYATDHTVSACVSTNGEPCVAPSVASAADGSYPIARPLLMYTDGPPTGALKAYLDWILSPSGQCLLAEKGYAPVSDSSCQNLASAS